MGNKGSRRKSSTCPEYEMTALSRKCLHPTVLLFWVMGSFSSKLSANVLREIHYFLQDPFLVHILDQWITVFDAGLKVWKCAKLRRELRVLDYCTFVMISAQEVVAIANFPETQHEGPKICIIDLSGNVKILPNLISPGAPGLYYFQIDHLLMAFGGGQHWKAVRDIQTLSIGSDHWTLLQQQMYYPRAYFSPIEHLNSLYLIDNYSRVEKFCLKTWTISLLLVGNMFKGWDILAALYDDCIYLFSLYDCFIYYIKRNEYRNFHLREKMQTETFHNSVIVKNTLISVIYPNYFTIDLSNMRFRYFSP